jgi:hypothetical protein
VPDGVGTATLLRKTLKPELEIAIGAAFARAARGRGFLAVLGVRAVADPPAAPSIGDLLEEHDPRWVARLSDEIRRAADRQFVVHFGARLYDQRYRTIVDAERLTVTIISVSPAAAFVLTNHWSGYVREAAVRAVTAVDGPFALALLVHRLNDWVREVRQAAEEKLLQLRGRIRPDTVAACIEHIWEFERYGRAAPSARQVIGELARAPAVLTALRKSLHDANDARSLRLARRLLRSDFLDGDLEPMSADHKNAAVRAFAARALLTGVYRWLDGRESRERVVGFAGSKRDLALRAMRDRSPKVQAAGLEWIVENRASLGDAPQLLLPFATHRAPGVAGLAQFGLTQLGVQWLGAVRSRLVGPMGPSRDVANTLAEHGDANDGQRIYELALDLKPFAALPFLAASARLKNDAAIEKLTATALGDPDLTLSSRASALLKHARVDIALDRLAPVADQGEAFFARGLGRFVGRLDAAEQLEILCRLERAGAMLDLDAWFQVTRRRLNRARFAPSAAQQARLNELLRECPGVRSRARLLMIGSDQHLKT